MIRIACSLMLLQRFFSSAVGSDYNIGLQHKLRLLLLMVRNRRRVVTASGFLEQLVMLSTLLQIPKSTSGAVVECGTYQGGSAVNFSLACRLMGRKLIVFDSFAGLPEPAESDKSHHVLINDNFNLYAKGYWSASLELVKGNISRFGAIETCEMVPGYFEKSLPLFTQSVCFAFCDVDLRTSLETCMLNLWPLLQDGSPFFTHEAHHMEIAGLFFDSEWWHRHFDRNAPGLVGAGSGLGLYRQEQGFLGSSLGYTIKQPSGTAGSDESGVCEDAENATNSRIST